MVVAVKIVCLQLSLDLGATLYEIHFFLTLQSLKICLNKVFFFSVNHGLKYLTEEEM